MLIEPLPLSELEEVPPEIYGGKAAGLKRLQSLGVSTPMTWVIPVKHTFDRGDVDLFALFSPFSYSLESFKLNYRNTVKFAVRSGAPVSMPGMLESKLNVDIDDVPAAVSQVWDSWHADNAVAYREENNISHSMGTGVVIQQMVNLDSCHSKNAFIEMFSGVAFTSDPNQPLLVNFNPTIEAVDGTGESLVGGTNSGFKVTVDSHAFSGMLRASLETIHEAFGPSDVEWVVRKRAGWRQDCQLTFVQHRPMRFAKIDQAQIAVGDVIVKGESVGSRCRISAPVTNDPADAKGKILMLRTFEPKNYSAMLKSAGMLVAAGGTTCHAAIVARDMGKVCISGVYSPALVNLPAVVLDGFTGEVLYAVEHDTTNHVDTEITSKMIPERLPDLSIAQKGKYRAEQLLARFYTTVHREHTGEITRDERDRVVGEIADVMCCYLYLSTTCEARHAGGGRTAQPKKGTRLKEGFRFALKKLGIEIPRSSQNRVSFAQTIPQPKNIREAAKVTKYVHRFFTELKWVSSFGGPKWGNISSLLLDYLNGRLSDLFFVDSAFNLQHNGGSVFGKFDWMLSDAGILNSQLDFKRDGAVEKLMSPTIMGGANLHMCKEFVWRDSILPTEDADNETMQQEVTISKWLRGLGDVYYHLPSSYKYPIGFKKLKVAVPTEGDYFYSTTGYVVKCQGEFDAKRIILVPSVNGEIEVEEVEVPSVVPDWGVSPNTTSPLQLAMEGGLGFGSSYYYMLQAFEDAPKEDLSGYDLVFRSPEEGEAFLAIGGRIDVAEYDWTNKRIVLIPKTPKKKTTLSQIARDSGVNKYSPYLTALDNWEAGTCFNLSNYDASYTHPIKGEFVITIAGWLDVATEDDNDQWRIVLTPKTVKKSEFPPLPPLELSKEVTI